MGSLKLNGSTSGHVEISAPAVAGTTSVEFPTDVVLQEQMAAEFAARPGHNLLHNGAMQVHQRGTSTAGITASTYGAADRWMAIVGTLGTHTQSVESDAPTGSGFRKSTKLLVTTADASPAAGGYLFIRQVIEGQNLQSAKKGTASAEQLTLSFWTKSNKTGVYVVELYDVDNLRICASTYTVDASATWEQQTITFPADATGAFDNDNDSSLQVNFWLATGSDFSSGTLNTTWAAYDATDRAVGQTNLAASNNNYWQVTGVQLEVGSAATGFEHKDYGRELAECQRYFIRVVEGANDPVCMMLAYNANDGYGTLSLPVTMRAAPTLSIASGTNYWSFYYNNTSDAFDALVESVTSPNTIEVRATTGFSATAAHVGFLRSGHANCYINASADL